MSSRSPRDASRGWTEVPPTDPPDPTIEGAKLAVVETLRLILGATPGESVVQAARRVVRERDQARQQIRVPDSR